MKVKWRLVCLGLLLATVLLGGCACDGCSCEVYGTTLEGPNVLFAPFLAIWNWIWKAFTPKFWDILKVVWDMPGAIVWLAGPVAYLLGAALYLAILAVCLAVDIVLGVLAGVLWFIIALFGGICTSCK